MIHRLSCALATTLLLCAPQCVRAQDAAAQPGSSLVSPPPFRPGELWPDTSGVPINAHGAGFLFHDGVYYWFGEFKTAGPGGNAANVGVSVYSSRDLYHWKNDGIALKVSDDPASDIVKGCVIERPKVLYNARTKMFVMWFHLELKGQGYRAARAGIATSKSPTGPYTFVRDFRPDGEMSRDMTLFQDDDGKAYLITTSENNQTQHVSELTPDFVDTTGHYTRILAHKALEGEAIFKWKGHYFYIGSHTTGWAPNPAFAAVADSITGPWKEFGNPCRGPGAELTFGAQSTYVLPVAGKPGAFIFIADRWRPKNAIDGRYVWLPITLEDDRFIIEWRPEWQLNVFATESK
ncbi:MAG TPA: glycoside hydrolase family 43 protein [Acidobacteriaceae bacterium]|nr:glycoside hydrolase family 43 protein [Acidobacteriaceae bacterium]